MPYHDWRRAVSGSAKNGIRIGEERYQEIKRDIECQRPATEVNEIIREPGAMTFATVDVNFEHLGTLVAPEHRPAEPRSTASRPCRSVRDIG
jgi:hypothetical protein